VLCCGGAERSTKLFDSGKRANAATSLRILLIEDVPPRAERLTGRLAALGHAVVVAPRKPEARFVLGIAQPDLVVCNLEVIRRAGWEIDAWLRSFREGQEMVVLFYVVAEGREEASSRGWGAVAGAPVTWRVVVLDEVEEAVREMVSTREKREGATDPR